MENLNDRRLDRPNDRLDELEAQSIYVFREAFAKLDKVALLWSLGKDSNVMIWLARKAFLGHVPFPAMHVDTGFERPAFSNAERTRDSGVAQADSARRGNAITIWRIKNSGLLNIACIF